jgi:quercetin dioxygenase-like cupin family protein
MTDTDNLKGVPINLSKSIDYADGAIVSKTLLDKKTGTLTLFSFDKGQGLSEHTSPYDATVIVLDGVARLTVDGQQIAAKTGEMVIMPANIPHDVQADERFKMLLVMIR